MRFLRRAPFTGGHLAILSSAFHPPTKAHLALARAALHKGHADEVLFVLPAELPHKEYDRVPIEDRLNLVLLVTETESRYSVAVSKGGLFLEIARECRKHYPPQVRLRFLCGRDAAARIVGWDYRPLPSIGEQLEEFELLVAPRDGVYTPPPEVAHAVLALGVDSQIDGISSSRVRERIEEGKPWRSLVPEEIHRMVERLYRGA
jgi:nicotinate-nucleotide adenylyltransferase